MYDTARDVYVRAGGKPDEHERDGLRSIVGARSRIRNGNKPINRGLCRNGGRGKRLKNHGNKKAAECAHYQFSHSIDHC